MVDKFRYLGAQISTKNKLAKEEMNSRIERATKLANRVARLAINIKTCLTLAKAIKQHKEGLEAKEKQRGRNLEGSQIQLKRGPKTGHHNCDSATSIYRGQRGSTHHEEKCDVQGSPF